MVELSLFLVLKDISVGSCRISFLFEDLYSNLSIKNPLESIKQVFLFTSISIPLRLQCVSKILKIRLLSFKLTS